MKCPRDRSVLVFTDEGPHSRNKCPACKGILVGKDEVALALGGKAPDAARIAALPESGVACPRDGSTLRRVENHGVEVDLCAECLSVWLDAGELEKIVAPGKKAQRAKVGVAAAAAGAAGVAALAAAQPAQAQSFVSSLTDGAGGVLAEGAIDLALELVGEVLSGLF
jgi:Zn-finger nucleic acid-binding protein